MLQKWINAYFSLIIIIQVVYCAATKCDNIDVSQDELSYDLLSEIESIKNTEAEKEQIKNLKYTTVINKYNTEACLDCIDLCKDIFSDDIQDLTTIITLESFGRNVSMNDYTDEILYCLQKHVDTDESVFEIKNMTLSIQTVKKDKILEMYLLHKITSKQRFSFSTIEKITTALARHIIHEDFVNYINTIIIEHIVTQLHDSFCEEHCSNRNATLTEEADYRNLISHLFSSVEVRNINEEDIMCKVKRLYGYKNLVSNYTKHIKTKNECLNLEVLTKQKICDIATSIIDRRIFEKLQSTVKLEKKHFSIYNFSIEDFNSDFSYYRTFVDELIRRCFSNSKKIKGMSFRTFKNFIKDTCQANKSILARISYNFVTYPEVVAKTRRNGQIYDLGINASRFQCLSHLFMTERLTKANIDTICNIINDLRIDPVTCNNHLVFCNLKRNYGCTELQSSIKTHFDNRLSRGKGLKHCMTTILDMKIQVRKPQQNAVTLYTINEKNLTEMIQLCINENQNYAAARTDGLSLDNIFSEQKKIPTRPESQISIISGDLNIFDCDFKTVIENKYKGRSWKVVRISLKVEETYKRVFIIYIVLDTKKIWVDLIHELPYLGHLRNSKCYKNSKRIVHGLIHEVDVPHSMMKEILIYIKAAKKMALPFKLKESLFKNESEYWYIKSYRDIEFNYDTAENDVRNTIISKFSASVSEFINLDREVKESMTVSFDLLELQNGKLPFALARRFRASSNTNQRGREIEDRIIEMLQNVYLCKKNSDSCPVPGLSSTNEQTLIFIAANTRNNILLTDVTFGPGKYEKETKLFAIENLYEAISSGKSLLDNLQKIESIRFTNNALVDSCISLIEVLLVLGFNPLDEISEFFEKNRDMILDICMSIFYCQQKNDQEAKSENKVENKMIKQPVNLKSLAKDSLMGEIIGEAINLISLEQRKIRKHSRIWITTILNKEPNTYEQDLIENIMDYARACSFDIPEAASN